jgi:hypothetical protein
VISGLQPPFRISPSKRSFLSDNFYQFKFQPIRDPPEFQSYRDLSGGEPHGFRPDEIVLFSGGLDSLAGVIEELGLKTSAVSLWSAIGLPLKSQAARSNSSRRSENASAATGFFMCQFG